MKHSVQDETQLIVPVCRNGHPCPVRRPDGRCPICRKDQRTRFRLKQYERVNALDRARGMMHREARKVRSARWRKENPERLRELRRRWYAANVDRFREQQRRYRARNPERVALLKHKHRLDRVARQRQAEGTYTIDHLTEMFLVQQRTCYWCGAGILLGPHGCEIDHVIPLTKGGSNWPENIALVCRSCNRRKSNLMPWEFQAR